MGIEAHEPGFGVAVLRRSAAGAAILLALSAGGLWADGTSPTGTGPQTLPVARPSADGNLRDAIQTLRQRFRLDSREGLAALRDLSLGVLREGLKDKDPYERCYAASALAGQGDWSGSGVLAEGIASADPGVRRAAIDGLGEIGSGEALRILRKLYAHSDPFGQLLVLQGLRGGRSAEAFDLMIDALQHSDEGLRLQAAEDLGLLGDTRAVPAVRQLLARQDARTFERITAAHALLRLGDHSGVPLLLTVVDGPPGTGRAAAALALGYAKEDRFVPVLKKLLRDDDIDVTIAAAAALSRYGSKEGLPRLRQALEDQDTFTRRHAATLLEHVEYGVAREVVLAGLEAKDVDVRLAAAQAVGTGGGERDIGALTAVMHSDQEPFVRAEVAWALGHMSTRKVIDPLVELVQENAPAVRYTAAEGIARTAERLIGSEEAVPQQAGVGAEPARHQRTAARRRNVS